MAMTRDEKGQAFFEAHWENVVKPVCGRGCDGLWGAAPEGSANRERWIAAALAYERRQSRARRKR